jgi:hypothetical protein
VAEGRAVEFLDVSEDHGFRGHIEPHGEGLRGEQALDLSIYIMYLHAHLTHEYRIIHTNAHGLIDKHTHVYIYTYIYIYELVRAQTLRKVPINK